MPKKKEFVSKKKRKNNCLPRPCRFWWLLKSQTLDLAILVHLKGYLDTQNDVQISLGRGLDCLRFFRRRRDSNLLRQPEIPGEKLFVNLINFAWANYRRPREKNDRSFTWDITTGRPLLKSLFTSHISNIQAVQHG